MSRFPKLIINNDKVISFFTKYLKKQKILVEEKLKIQNEIKNLKKRDVELSFDIAAIEKALSKAELLRIKNINNIGVEYGNRDNKII